MPIKPGQTLNPTGSDGGKKRLNKQLSELLIHNVPAAVKLVEKHLKSKEFEAEKWAVDTIFNRVYGKAQEFVELSGDADNPVAFVSEKPLTAAQFMLQYAPEADEDAE